MTLKRSKRKPFQILSAAAKRLKRQSTGMSLRTVSAKLDISPSYWCKILQGQKPLTPSLLPKVVKVLKLDSQQIGELQRAMVVAVETNHLAPVTGLQLMSESEGSQVSDYHELDRNDVWLLSDWYYLPLLDLFTLEDADFTHQEIAQRLGLSLYQVQNAIKRLLESGLLFQKGGRLHKTHQKLRFPTDRICPEFSRHNQRILQKAKEELDNNAPERFATRLISALSLAGSSEKFREARLILEEAMYRAANLMADAPQSDELYQISVQMFPLSKHSK